MKTILEELKESWKQPWPRESLLRPELAVVEETVPVSVPETGLESVGTNISTPEPDSMINHSIDTKKDTEKRGGKRGPHRVTGMNTIERRRAVLKMMKEHPEMNSKQIAKELGEPRGSVWHAILYIRSVMPELANWGVKGQGKWASQWGSTAETKSAD